MSSRQVTNWISLSDMMTGLMLVFLLIAVLSISQVVVREQERQDLLDEYDLSKEEIYSDLEDTFGEKKTEWGIEIDRDLSIKFQNPDVLFGYLSADISPEFSLILEEFIPLYLGIINKEKYQDKIKEVRVEGHTADWDDYMFTVKLSQERANAVLSNILNNSYYNNLDVKTKDKIKFWFTANGLGNGRTLDKEGEFTYYSNKDIGTNSRRVEFRIVTTSDELIEEIINNKK